MSKPVDGVAVIVRLHQEIAVDLRHDGSRGDGDTSRVAVDQRNLRHLQRFDGHGVEQQHVRADVQILHRLGHGQLAGAEDVDGIDGPRLDHTDSYGPGAAEDVTAGGDSVIEVEDLGVVDADHGRLAVEDDRGGDDRAGQTAAADLVRTGDGAKTKIAEPGLDRGN